MVIWVEFSKVILALLGLAFCSIILLYLKKKSQFKNFDHSSSNFINELYQALGSMKFDDIKKICENEGSSLAHLTLMLISEKESYQRINIHEETLISEKHQLSQYLELFTLSYWIIPISATFYSFLEISSLFFYTEEFLKIKELGPITMAFQLVFCFFVCALGLGFSLFSYFLKTILLKKMNILIEELDFSGQEVMTILKEVENSKP